MTKFFDQRSRRHSWVASSNNAQDINSATEVKGSTHASPALKHLDWLNLHYARFPAPAQLASRISNPQAPPSTALRSRWQTPRVFSSEFHPTMAEGFAAASALGGGLIFPPFSNLATGLSGAALFGSALRGSQNFIRAPRSKLADAFDLTNIVAGLNTAYTAFPLPQWSHANFASATLTAIGAMPSLYRGLSGTAHNRATSALRLLSGMGYVTSAGLALQSGRHSSNGDSMSAARDANLSNLAWLAAWSLSAAADYTEARNTGNDASRPPSTPLLEEANSPYQWAPSK